MAGAGVSIGERLRFESLSSHTARMTIQFLKKINVNFIDKEKWLPKSPGAAPMDFGIWGILKRCLQKRNANTLLGLKQALKDEWNKLDQKTINKTLESWPKRCKLRSSSDKAYIFPS